MTRFELKEIHNEPDEPESDVCGQCGEQLPGDTGDWGECLNRCQSCTRHMNIVERADIWDCPECRETYIWDKNKQEFRLIPLTHEDADAMGEAENLTTKEKQ